MKVREIEINGKVYRANYINNKSDVNVCDSCDLKPQCVADTEDEISGLCLNNAFECYFKEVKETKAEIKTNNPNKFYKFSSGTMFHLNHIKDIIDMDYVEKCPTDPTKYSFSILLINAVAINVRFNTKVIANRERNKFIKFIEEYETLD